VRPLAYWSANYAFDILNYLIICVVVLLIFLAYDNASFVGSGELTAATFLLFFLYGLAAIPLAYLLSFLFDSHTSSQLGIAGINFVCGFLLVIASFVLDGIVQTANTNAALKPLYRLFPPFCLGEGMINLSSANLISLVTATSSSPFAWDQLGREYVYLACECFAFFTATVLVDLRVLERIKLVLLRCYHRYEKPASAGPGAEAEHLAAEEDPDIRAERDRVDRIAERGVQQSDELLVISHLSKQFPDLPLCTSGPPKIAVRDLCLTVGQKRNRRGAVLDGGSQRTGEVFGFLGVNGAGTNAIPAADCAPLLIRHASPLTVRAVSCAFSVCFQAKRRLCQC
jgi:hypothetical protein